MTVSLTSGSRNTNCRDTWSVVPAALRMTVMSNGVPFFAPEVSSVTVVVSASQSNSPMTTLTVGWSRSLSRFGATRPRDTFGEGARRGVGSGPAPWSLTVGVGAGLGESVGVGVGLGECVGLGVGVEVGETVSVGPGVGETTGVGADGTTSSAVAAGSAHIETATATSAHAPTRRCVALGYMAPLAL